MKTLKWRPSPFIHTFDLGVFSEPGRGNTNQTPRLRESNYGTLSLDRIIGLIPNMLAKLALDTLYRIPCVCV